MIPRGIEILVKKASVDGEFRRHLLTERADAAVRIGLELTIAEANMLSSIPQSQLIAIIGSTRVSPRLRPAFMGYAAAAMLAPIGIVVVGCEEKTNITNDEIEDEINILNEKPKHEYVFAESTGIRPGMIVSARSVDTSAPIQTQITILNVKGASKDDPNRYMEDIVVQVETYAEDILNVYYRILNKYPEFASFRLLLGFEIKADGSVGTITLDDTLQSKGDKELANGIINQIEDWQFSPSTNIVTVGCEFAFENGYRDEK